jgi:hypothetical protein
MFCSWYPPVIWMFEDTTKIGAEAMVANFCEVCAFVPYWKLGVDI